MIELKKDCPFCELGQNEIGCINDRGSGIVFSTGKDPEKDWYIILQPTTASDPETGMNYQVMPIGHLITLSDMEHIIHKENLGSALHLTSKVQETILKRDYHEIKGIEYKTDMMINAKCKEGGKFPHMHFKLIPRTGPAGWEGPLDAGYDPQKVPTESYPEYKGKKNQTKDCTCKVEGAF